MADTYMQLKLYQFYIFRLTLDNMSNNLFYANRTEITAATRCRYPARRTPSAEETNGATRSISIFVGRIARPSVYMNKGIITTGEARMNYENLSPELKEKAKACKTAEDVLKLAQEEGYELSDDELESISGGGWECPVLCSGLCQVFDKTCPRRDY